MLQPLGVRLGRVLSIWPKDRTLSGATTLSQIGLGSDGNKVVLRISQSSRITETSLSGCLGLVWGVSYRSAEVQSMYSTAPVDWVRDLNIRVNRHKVMNKNFLSFLFFFQFSANENIFITWLIPLWRYFDAVLNWFFFSLLF